MKPSSYREQDYAFGQQMLTLRSALGLTQGGLAQALGVSRRSVADWEAGAKYPKAAHLKQLVALAVAHHAFQAGQEADAIRTLWKAARQKELLSEAWLAEVLAQEQVTRAKPDAEQPPTNNLPFQPTTFVGRSAELTAISRLLADPACRLLTLHGPGGIGKTRLALAVAANAAAAFPDSVAYVALASISMPGQIVSAIGDVLRLPFDGQSDPTAHLLSDLRARHMLLVLDNFEHLLDEAELVSTLLAHAPHVKVLVTSRERLNLQAEWLFTVDGLSFPHQPQNPPVSQSPASLMQYSAVELFLERARQVQPALVLDEAALASIVQICHYVAGMPLALELAAANTRVVSLAEIEQQLGKNLNELATNLRDVAPRHRSMRAVFDHSWNLLSREEGALVSRLAVFHSGWAAEAAFEVAGATTDLLTALIDKSLVRSSSEVGSTTDTRPSGLASRFTMLEPIRGYALEQLAARGEEATVRHAHATYYLELAEAAAAQWNTPLKEAANAQLGRELNNMHAALQWAYDTGDSTLGLRFALALWRFWRRFGYISEGRAWIGQLLSLDEHPADVAALRVRERTLHAAAWLASDQHDYANASRLFEQSLALRRRLRETSGQTNLADPLHNAAAARQARAEGNYRQAAALLEELLARHRLVGDRTTEGNASLELSPDELGQALREFGTVLREQGDFVRATALFEQALALYHTIGDRASETFVLIGLGDIARDQGDSASVRAYCELNLAILHDFGIQWAVGFALNNLALAAYYERDLTHASALIHESVALFRAISADTSLSEVLITLGTILLAQGDAVAAYDALTEALRLAWAVGPRLFVALALERLANVLVSQGDAELAARLLAGASALRARMGTPIRPVDRADVEQVLATARAALGEAAFATVWDEAQTQLLEQVLSTIPRIATFKALRER
jgi:predicted ATPase/transcriptional regulator with XRE-family HTH domain